MRDVEYVWYSPDKDALFTTGAGFFDYIDMAGYWANWYGYGDCLFLGKL